MMDMRVRPIKSDLKSYRIVPERKEKPSKWAFTKVLREFSTLKEFYPEINPYVEAYKFRDNLYCLYSESLLAGGADMWGYLIIGPEKALLVDTGYGVGNIKKLCEKLAPGKEILAANTHCHTDHCGGNICFDEIYIHEYDVKGLLQNRSPHFWDQLYDADLKPRDTYFDPDDIVPYRPYKIHPLKDGDLINLGGDYNVELVHLPGHTAGQSAYFDHKTGCIFVGDITCFFRSYGDGRAKDEEHPEYCTLKAFVEAMRRLQPRFEKMSGMFPGHGTLDMHPMVMQFTLDAAEKGLREPTNSDIQMTYPNGMSFYSNIIFQDGSDLKYMLDALE